MSLSSSYSEFRRREQRLPQEVLDHIIGYLGDIFRHSHELNLLINVLLVSRACKVSNTLHKQHYPSYLNSARVLLTYS
jgi:hypothetical protein